MNRRLASVMVAIALTAPVSVALTTSSAEAKGLYYSSCDRLHRDYKHGVARSAKAARKQLRDGYGLPASGPRARKVYRQNHSRLDRDNDGTACEA